MLFSYVSVVLSICTCIAELSSEILGEMQLELLFTTPALKQTLGFTHFHHKNKNIFTFIS